MRHRTTFAADASPADQLRTCIELRTARVAVIGLGYVGLPLAETFAWAGYPVTGFDVDPEKVRKLRLGQSYVGHVASERVTELVRDGRFVPTADPRALGAADAVVVCVPTPLTEAREPDLTHLVATGRTVREHLRPGQLIVLESATYPGTTESVFLPLLEESGLKAGRDFFLAFSPEREDPGNPYYSTRTIPVVVGGVDPVSRDLAVALYTPVAGNVVPVSSAAVAEAAKILENTYRAVNVALVNELKVAFDRMGVDVWEVIDAAKTKPFGFQPFYPGPGLGGHCIPTDPFSLAWAAKRAGVETPFVELAGKVNASMPGYVVSRVAEALRDAGHAMQGSRVCVLGVAYKKDVDDPGESPAFEIIDLLRARGVHVSYHDPYVPVLPKTRRHSFKLESSPLTEEYLRNQDCVLIVTDHSRFNWEFIARHARLIVDTRNATRDLPPGLCPVCKA